MIDGNYYKIGHIKNCKTLKLFIDCSFIYNMYCVNCQQAVKLLFKDIERKNVLGELSYASMSRQLK